MANRAGLSVQALGGRRFILAITTFAGCSILLWFGRLSDGAFTTITMTSVGALIAGHTYENVKTAGLPARNEPSGS